MQALAFATNQGIMEDPLDLSEFLQGMAIDRDGWAVTALVLHNSVNYVPYYSFVLTL